MIRGRMPYLLAQQDWSWPEAAPVEEPLRTPLWLIRTLADALAAEEQPSVAHRQHVARPAAGAAEELERPLAAGPSRRSSGSAARGAPERRPWRRRSPAGTACGSTAPT